MYKIIFKHPDQAYIYKSLLDAVTKLCNDYKKDALCVAGYRSLKCQIETNQQVLKRCSTNYQLKNGAVYNNKGQCLASAYGQSNHCFCIAMDFNGWIESLTNKQLEPYGLHKPMDYEPWHIQLIEHIGITKKQKETIRNEVLKGMSEDMEIKEFQAMTGLLEDGVSGPITQAKAKEVLQVCQKILKNDFNTANEAIIATQNEPSAWIDKIKQTKYGEAFVMNIVKRMRGV